LLEEKTTKKNLKAAEVKPQEMVGQEPPGEEQAVNESGFAPKAPPPIATGDDKITIVKHDICTKAGKCGSKTIASIELGVKNVSDKVIGSVLFEAVFYDAEGNTLDSVEHKIFELLPGINRSLRIISKKPEGDKAKSYYVKTLKTVMTPEPNVTGNEEVEILKHTFIDAYQDGKDEYTASIEIAIKNVSDSTIATVIFRTLFYDIEGNTIDTTKHNAVDIKAGRSRAILIDSSITEPGDVKSYDIRVTRTTTAGVEKVQLRGQEMIITKAGEDLVKGTVKNISDVKTDAAIVAIFYNPEKESIGTRVIILKDIEPGTIRPFQFLFKPREGDTVRTCTLHIDDTVEK